MKKQIIVFLMVLGIVGTACAIPTWNRGDQGSTFQEWHFFTDVNPATPDIAYNPYAPLFGFGIEANITTYGTALPTYSDGAWSGSSLNFATTIPNTDVTVVGSRKYMVVEMGYKGSPSLATVTADGAIYLSFAQEMGTYDGNNGETWNFIREYYYITPNPTSESLCIGLSFTNGDNTDLQYLDYVKVDTICVAPVPGAALLAGFGAGLVGWIRRRKKL